MPVPPNIRHYADGTASVLRKPVVYTALRFYQRSDVLYQLTRLFCQRYLPSHGDRTVDQMVQAARSTKQNIAEGCSDGQTSMESELKLLGVARGSNKELQEDYQDYLKRCGKHEWFGNNERFDRLHTFCKEHSKYEDYRDLLPKLDDEELANMAICLCHQVDAALTKYIEQRDREFTTEGGIRERMTAARLEQRQTQKEIINGQEATINELKATISQQEATINQLKATISQQEATINELKATISQQEATINELKATISQQEATINELKATISRQEAMIKELEERTKDTSPHPSPEGREKPHPNPPL